MIASIVCPATHAAQRPSGGRAAVPSCPWLVPPWSRQGSSAPVSAGARRHAARFSASRISGHPLMSSWGSPSSRRPYSHAGGRSGGVRAGGPGSGLRSGGPPRSAGTRRRHRMAFSPRRSDAGRALTSACVVGPLTVARSVSASWVQGDSCSGCHRSSCHRILTRNHAGWNLEEFSSIEVVSGTHPAEEGGQGLPGDRGERKRQRRHRSRAFGRGDRGVSAEPGDMAVWAARSGRSSVAFHRPATPTACCRRRPELPPQLARRPTAKVRVIGQAPPAVGSEPFELVGLAALAPRGSCARARSRGPCRYCARKSS